VLLSDISLAFNYFNRSSDEAGDNQDDWMQVMMKTNTVVVNEPAFMSIPKEVEKCYF
jgi:hypothetical protein